MSTITSRQNPIVRLAHSLRLKKVRKESGRFLCEGERVVDELLKTDWQVDHLIVCADTTNEPHCVKRACARNIPVTMVSESISQYIGQTEQPQGVFAIAAIKETSISSLKPLDSALVVLDAISDPGNVGSIIRTALAFGCDGVILIGECADPFGDKTIRASAGSLFHVPVVQAKDANEVVKFLSRHSIPLYVASAHEGSPPWSLTLSPPLAMAFGHETRGIRAELARARRGDVTIPLGERAESLNVASAAAAVLYETMRQRK